MAPSKPPPLPPPPAAPSEATDVYTILAITFIAIVAALLVTRLLLTCIGCSLFVEERETPPMVEVVPVDSGRPGCRRGGNAV